MGEIIGLPTAITYYPKHQNIHSSDERTEIKGDATNLLI